jgi:hypothetical protein
MGRAVGTVLVLLAVCLVLPVLAGYAVKAVPLLVSLLVVLALLRLLVSPRSNRGRWHR